MNVVMRVDKRDKLRLTDNWLAKHGQGLETDSGGEKRGKTTESMGERSAVQQLACRQQTGRDKDMACLLP